MIGGFDVGGFSADAADAILICIAKVITRFYVLSKGELRTQIQVKASWS